MGLSSLNRMERYRCSDRKGERNMYLGLVDILLLSSTSFPLFAASVLLRRRHWSTSFELEIGS